MKKIRRFFISGASFEKVLVFRKLVFAAVVFSAVFYFHHGSEHHDDGRSLSVAISEANSAQNQVVIQNTINLNTASLKELIALPGIGPKLAEVIVKDREQNGPFLQLNDFLRVKGIGPKKLEKIAPFLHFEAPPK